MTERDLSTQSPDPEPESPAPAPTGLLFSRDLIFTSKVTGTARALGYRVHVAGDLALAGSLIEQWRPVVVFVDLAAVDLAGIPALLAYRKLAGPATAFIAFGSHVDTHALDAAREAGCDLVLPRSQFSAELPALIRRAFSAESAEREEGNVPRKTQKNTERGE